MDVNALAVRPVVNWILSVWKFRNRNDGLYQRMAWQAMVIDMGNESLLVMKGPKIELAHDRWQWCWQARAQERPFGKLDLLVTSYFSTIECPYCILMAMLSCSFFHVPLESNFPQSIQCEATHRHSGIAGISSVPSDLSRTWTEMLLTMRRRDAANQQFLIILSCFEVIFCSSSGPSMYFFDKRDRAIVFWFTTKQVLKFQCPMG